MKFTTGIVFKIDLSRFKVAYNSSVSALQCEALRDHPRGREIAREI